MEQIEYLSLLRLSIDPINNYQALTILLSLIHYFQLDQKYFKKYLSLTYLEYLRINIYHKILSINNIKFKFTKVPHLYNFYLTLTFIQLLLKPFANK